MTTETDRTSDNLPAPADRAYRAVCFDLDGTLLPMDIDEFLRNYFQALGAFAASRGLNVAELLPAVKSAVGRMATHKDRRLNAEVFWERFYELVDPKAADWEAFFEDFYEHEFGKLGDGFQADLHAAAAVNTLVAKGYPLVLTTMPLFPRNAVEWRLRWAGVDPAVFSRITVFDNSTAAKPSLDYYAENLAALGAIGADVLMVGNNTVEDLAFCDLGADAFLVTDWLLDPVNLDLSTVRHGTLAQFAEWVETLPACANPLSAVHGGPVPEADRTQALAANAAAANETEA